MLRRESVVIEGVHINMKFIKNLYMKHSYIIPFYIYIENAEKHKQRFFVRSKNMTLDPKKNKYVGSFDFIRTIQQHIIMNADNHRVPLVNNNNVDKSVGLIQQTILKGLRKILTKNEIYDKTTNSLFVLNDIYKDLSSQILTSKQANLLVINNAKINKIESVNSDLIKSIKENESTNQKANDKIVLTGKVINKKGQNTLVNANEEVDVEEQQLEENNREDSNQVNLTMKKALSIKEKKIVFNESLSDDENKKKKDLTRENPHTEFRREKIQKKIENEKKSKKKASNIHSGNFYSQRKDARNNSEASLNENSFDSKGDAQCKEGENQIIVETDDDDYNDEIENFNY